jgi:hypothetical protein
MKSAADCHAPTFERSIQLACVNAHNLPPGKVPPTRIPEVPPKVISSTKSATTDGSALNNFFDHSQSILAVFIEDVFAVIEVEFRYMRI